MRRVVTCRRCGHWVGVVEIEWNGRHGAFAGWTWDWVRKGYECEHVRNEKDAERSAYPVLDGAMREIEQDCYA